MATASAGVAASLTALSGRDFLSSADFLPMKPQPCSSLLLS